MMTKLFGALTGLALTLALPLGAHHAFAAEFDAKKPVELKGTVTKLEWTNPHIWVYMDVKDATGKIAKWECEGGPPNSLTRGGWTRNLIKTGDEIELQGSQAKDGSNTCNTKAVKLPDGRTLAAGSTEGFLKTSTTPKQ